MVSVKGKTREVMTSGNGENILDGYATFYAAHSEAGAAREARYYARLPF